MSIENILQEAKERLSGVSVEVLSEIDTSKYYPSGSWAGTNSEGEFSSSYSDSQYAPDKRLVVRCGGFDFEIYSVIDFSNTILCTGDIGLKGWVKKQIDSIIIEKNKQQVLAVYRKFGGIVCPDGRIADKSMFSTIEKLIIAGISPEKDIISIPSMDIDDFIWFSQVEGISLQEAVLFPIDDVVEYKKTLTARQRIASRI